MTTLRRAALPASLLLALAACGSPTAASKANFEAALDKHYADHCLFISPSVGLTAYPATIDAATDTSRFDALVSAGLLTASAASTEHAGVLGIGTTRSESKTYALTDAGRAAFHGDAGAAGGFCAGHYAVASVDGFSAPTASGGVTVSQVTFTVDPHWQAWVANPAVQDRYGGQLSQVQRTQDHATLERMSDGWVVQGDAS